MAKHERGAMMAISPIIKDFEYSKRGLTDNIILKVVSNDADMPLANPEGFLDLVKDFSDAETVGQQNMCLGGANPEVSAFVPPVREAYPGVRFRKLQFAKILSIGDARNLSEDFAETLLESGSIALIATSFDDESVTALLKFGILPLVSDKPVAVGTVLLIKGITNDIWLNCKELTAYEVTDALTPYALRLPNLYIGQEPTYKLDHLDRLLKD